MSSHRIESANETKSDVMLPSIRREDKSTDMKVSREHSHRRYTNVQSNHLSREDEVVADTFVHLYSIEESSRDTSKHTAIRSKRYTNFHTQTSEIKSVVSLPKI